MSAHARARIENVQILTISGRIFMNMVWTWLRAKKIDNASWKIKNKKYVRLTRCFQNFYLNRMNKRYRSTTCCQQNGVIFEYEDEKIPKWMWWKAKPFSFFFHRKKRINEHQKLQFCKIDWLLAYPPRIGGKPYAFGVWHGELLIIVAGVQPIISTPFIHTHIK